MQQHILEGFARARAQLAELESGSEQAQSKRSARNRQNYLRRIQSRFAQWNHKTSLRGKTARTA